MKIFFGILLAVLLTGCDRKGYTPPTVPPAQAGWSRAVIPGQLCDNFDFTSNPLSYCYNGTIKPRLGQTITITFTISGTGKLVVDDANDLPPPTLSLFLWRRGDNMTCAGQMQQYRWWSGRTEIGTGTYTVSVKVTPENWTDCYGKSGAENVALFQAALNDLSGVGYTLGGKWFAGHGLKSEGPLHFRIDSFIVQ